MNLIYIDEAGYEYKWDSNPNRQPYYVLAAVAFPAEKYLELETNIKRELQSLKIPGYSCDQLGYGTEIKARQVAKGSGFWGKNNELRNKVRDTYLSYPAKNNLTTFVVVIDKKAHMSRYAWPQNPHYLAIQFLFERLQLYLSKNNDYGVCIYDLNHGEEGRLTRNVSKLFRIGSPIQYWSEYFNEVVSRRQQFDHIMEFTFCRSEYSLGIQLADFFASMAYQYHKGGCPSGCGWWDVLYSSIFEHNDRKEGFGYKVFPQ